MRRPKEFISACPSFASHNSICKNGF